MEGSGQKHAFEVRQAQVPVSTAPLSHCGQCTSYSSAPGVHSLRDADAKPSLIGVWGELVRSCIQMPNAVNEDFSGFSIEKHIQSSRQPGLFPHQKRGSTVSRTLALLACPHTPVSHHSSSMDLPLPLPSPAASPLESRSHHAAPRYSISAERWEGKQADRPGSQSQLVPQTTSDHS